MSASASSGKTAVLVGFFGTVAISVAILMQLDYLAPLAPQIVSLSWSWIVAWLGMVFLHLTAVSLWAIRRFQFRRSGLRLGHLEREIRSGEAPYAEEFRKEWGDPK